MPDRVPSISILLPCYNVEPYLPQCLASVAAQTFEDFEVVCVNDGSTDGTPGILQNFIESDSRFRLIDKENGGYGAAVNVALEQARGQWVAIVEPDDYLPPDAFENLFSGTQLADSTPDIVKGSYRDLFDDLPDAPRFTPPPLEKKMPKITRQFTISQFPEVLFHHPSIWTCLYRRDFLESHHIRMVEAPGAGWTDNPWLFETFLNSQLCVWVPEVCYFYRQKESIDSRRVSDVNIPFDRLREMSEIIKRTGYSQNKNVQAAHAKRTFSYIDLVIDKWGFAESDPHVYSLVLEALKALDSKAVTTSNRLPSSARIYYRDVSGRLLKELPKHKVSQSPALSIFLFTSSDRRVLWQTIRSLSRQSMADFEVFCIDDGSKDRTVSILRDVAQKDRRFRVIDEQGDAAFACAVDEAQAPWCMFLRPGLVLPSQWWLNSLMHELTDRLPEDLVTIKPAQNARLAGSVSASYIMHRDSLRSPKTSKVFFEDDGISIVFDALRTSRETFRSTLDPIQVTQRWRFLAWRTQSSQEAADDIRRRCDALASAHEEHLPNIFASREIAREIRDAFMVCGTTLRREDYFNELCSMLGCADYRLENAALSDSDTRRILDELTHMREQGYEAWSAECQTRRELANPSTPRYYPRKIIAAFQRFKNR